MTEQPPHQTASILARSDQPLIGIITEQDGQEMVHYFADEQAADAAAGKDNVRKALELIGAWRNLMDWEDVERDLDRIRHESEPTPPVEP